MVSTRGRSAAASARPRVSGGGAASAAAAAGQQRWRVAKRQRQWDCQRNKQETRALRDKYIGASCQLMFRRDPLKIVRGRMQYMFEQDGTQYLDCINNVAHVGHCHPQVVQAGCKQMRTLQTNNRYLHDHIVSLAEKLCATMPQQLSVCFFVNSGSEANDLAQRMAFYYAKSREAICQENAYHGHVKSCIDISPYKLYHAGCEEPKPDCVHVVPAPDRYRGKYRDSEHSLQELTDLYVKEVEAVCDRLVADGRSAGFFIAESLQSCGGQIMSPPGYLRRVYAAVRAAGGVCIADEVQTGFGRVGTKWWAFQLEEADDAVVPDIVTIGKPMGNGHPISAVVTRPEIAAAFRRGPDYFNTYGGNPVSCAIGLAVLDVIEEERLMENAATVGGYFKERLAELQKRHPMIGDVRGEGLFVGIDLVLSRELRTPATQAAEAILWRLRDRKILMSLDGPHVNILKFKPPMCFSKENVDQLAEALDAVLTEAETSEIRVEAAAR